MTRTGKIARLPHEIREQLNRRLQDGQQAAPILAWLNALSEVRRLLSEHFHGSPISKQNLSDWHQGGFHEWEIQQNALDFVRSLEDKHALGHKSLAGPCTDKLARWSALQYAAAAQALSSLDLDSESRWSRLRQFCADICRLRHGDLFAECLGLERDWLKLENANAKYNREKLFWAWTKRPDIREKLDEEYDDKAPSSGLENLLNYAKTLKDNSIDVNALFGQGQKPASSPPVSQAQSNPVKPGQA